MKILGISGSLRKNAFNTQLLHAVKDYIPPAVDYDLIGIESLCLYNEDLDGDNKPESVIEFLARIQSADALLFATPEYNHSLPGGLKNAIDWASRPAFESVLKHKPCGILSATPSAVGGARAQADLKNVLDSTLSLIYPSVEYLLGSAHEKFNHDGKLIDATARRRLERYITGFVHWIPQT
ncbi:MAG: NAD(P)H-dependent oxidoreductase [Gammaproteobacteria bacterium]|nr:MAG: NAD(P)H-dependent oxidoreductase [Gammaproteobacteria bacterium]